LDEIVVRVVYREFGTNINIVIRIILILLGVFNVAGVVPVKGQLLFPIVGTYQGKGAQGMAIWEDWAYVFNDYGHCRTINLKDGKVVFEFDLACSGNKTHINAACFGVEKHNKSLIPVIYISETNNPYRCFVESIENEKSTLIQTIQFKENGVPFQISDWIVDKEHCSLYGINRKWNQYLDKDGNVENTIIKFRLPKLGEGKDIVLTAEDVQDVFTVLFANGMQDAAIRNSIMYIATGLDEMSNKKIDSGRAIIVVDLKKKRIIKKLDLSCVTTNEPEGIDFFGKRCLLFCGQNGGIYRVKTK
jgi:hypothetical protein